MTYFYLYWYIKVSLTSYNLQEQKPRLDPLQLWRALGWNVSIIAQIAQSPESLRVEKVYEATLSTPGNFNISLSIKKQSSSDTCSSSGQSCWSGEVSHDPCLTKPQVYIQCYIHVYTELSAEAASSATLHGQTPGFISVSVLTWFDFHK